MTTADTSEYRSVETPSGKDSSYENFPVGSVLLPKQARPHVAIFYRFARTIDDIADNPNLSPDEKIIRLEGFATAVRDEDGDREAYATGYRMAKSLTECGISTRHCLDLIDAFKQDARQSRYETWDDLMDYCDRSAAPVGRYLVDITGGASDGYASSDALCRALQVINHLQDCKADYQEMNRVYLPQAWMRDHGATTDMLAEKSSTPALRAVIDQCLGETRRLITDARALARTVRSRRLAMEGAAIVHIADVLIVELSRRDPLAERVKLSKLQYATCMFRGALRLFAR